MSSRRTKRARPVATVLGGLGLAGALLSACGPGGSGSLAEQACNDVNRSIALYQQSTRETGTAAAALRAEALVELRNALRPAAVAGASGGPYQALQATLSESSRVAESRLITALTAQCSLGRASATS